MRRIERGTVRTAPVSTLEQKDGKWVSDRKTVLTQIDETYYLVQMFYKYNTEPLVWYQCYKHHDEYQNAAKARVMARSLHDVSKYFDMLIEYEGFHAVEMDDATFDSAHIQKPAFAMDQVVNDNE